MPLLEGTVWGTNRSAALEALQFVKTQCGKCALAASVEIDLVTLVQLGVVARAPPYSMWA